MPCNGICLYLRNAFQIKKKFGLVFYLVETKAIDIPTQSILTASQPYPSQQPCVFSGVLGTGRKLINNMINI